MPKITIDGKELEVAAGSTIIQAIDKLGVPVPRYCYEPRLPVAGNCRMCLVEVEKMPKLVTSCTQPIADGMVVRTDNDRVKEARAAVLEFLLLNHPLDCPICDKAGECDLQNFYFEFSGRDSRLDVDEKVHKPKNQDIGKYIVLDNERCILCTRCIRFMDVVAKDPVLGIIDRGDHSTLTVFPDKRLDSRYSINTADICPVGALTSKEFRFRKRVWFLSHTKSVCPHCATGCPVNLDHDNGKIFRMMPGMRDGVETWLCDPGRLGYGFVNDPARPQMPVTKSVASGWQQVITDVKTAVETAVAGLKEVLDKNGPAGVAGIFSNWNTNEEAFAFVKLFRTMKSEMIALHKPLGGLVDSGPADDILVREDKNPNTRGTSEIAGALLKGIGLKTPAEIFDGVKNGKVRALVISDPDLLGRMNADDRKKAVEALKKAKMVIVLSPVANESSRAAHVHFATATWAEKDGSFTNGDGIVQRIRTAFKSAPGVLADLDVLSRLAVAMGLQPGAATAAEAFAGVAGEVPAFAGQTWASLEKGYGKLAGAPGTGTPPGPPGAEAHKAGQDVPKSGA